MPDDHATADPVADPCADTAGPGRRGWSGRPVVSYIAALIGLGIAGGLFVLPFVIGGAMASDACIGDHDPRFMCTRTGQWVVAFTPFAALGAGLVITVITGALLRRHGYNPALGVWFGVLIIIAGPVTSSALTQQHPPSENPAETQREIASLQDRPDIEQAQQRDQATAEALEQALSAAWPHTAWERDNPALTDACVDQYPALEDVSIAQERSSTDAAIHPDHTSFISTTD